LHLAGIGLGMGLSRLGSTRDALSRVAGGAIAVAGVVLAL
jgi:hydrogenase/urease accessory protein HupE